MTPSRHKPEAPATETAFLRWRFRLVSRIGNRPSYSCAGPYGQETARANLNLSSVFTATGGNGELDLRAWTIGRPRRSVRDRAGPARGTLKEPGDARQPSRSGRRRPTP